MLQDLRLALRLLIRNPSFSLVAIAALALGIASNTAVFSVVNTVLLRPIPFPNSDRMVVIWGNYQKLNIEHLRAKAADYVDYRDQTSRFESVAAFVTTDLNFTGRSAPERIRAASVSANLFDTVGALPAQGRLFAPDETHVVVISEGFWKQRLGHAPDVIGRSVRLNDEEYTVIGLMPAAFEFPHSSFNFAEPADVWIPLTFSTEQITERRRPFNLNVIALLKPGVTLDSARAEISMIGARIHPEEGGWRTTLVPLQEQIVGGSRRFLLMLFAAVTLVLLISCANAANLLLMRAMSRQKELAVRASIGASRLRLIRQMLTESLLISGLACIAGVLIAWWSLRFLLVLDPANLPRLHEISLDVRVVVFAISLALLTGLIFGVLPALRASRPELHRDLKGHGAGLTRHWLRGVLVISEMALATLLLIAAGLMINSVLRLQRVDPVVEADKLLSVQLNLPAYKYTEPSRMARFYDDIVQKVETLPGVESASLSTTQTLSGAATNDPFVIEGRPLDMNNAPVASWQLVTPGYFQTMGIPIIAGREFNAADHQPESGAAIVSQSLVERYFPGQDVLGKRLTLGLPRPDNPWLTIVGVAKDVPQRGLGSKAEPQWYIPLYKKPRGDFYLMVRSKGDPQSLERGIREQVLAIDKDQPVTEMKTLHQVISTTTAPRRFSTMLFLIFGTIAVALSALGIYSVMAYSVTQRAREIGIRVALGATNKTILKEIIARGMALAFAGAVIGIVLSQATSRLMAGLLYGVEPNDIATIGVVVIFLLAVGLIACYLPARRAARIDPVNALRSE